MKKLEAAVLFGLAVAVIFCLTGFMSFEKQCDGIRGKVLRLHVLANSDSEEDQALKLKVRDRLLEEGREILSGAENESEAAQKARENLGTLTRIAEDEVKRQGYDYPVTVKVERTYFGTRVYDNVTMPAGEYEALRVLIGSAEGKNWWCVMFPPMCLPAAEGGEGLQQENEKLEDVLDQKEMDIVTSPEKYELRFKTVEWFEEAGNFLKDLFGRSANS